MDILGIILAITAGICFLALMLFVGLFFCALMEKSDTDNQAYINLRLMQTIRDHDKETGDNVFDIVYGKEKEEDAHPAS